MDWGYFFRNLKKPFEKPNEIIREEKKGAHTAWTMLWEFVQAVEGEWSPEVLRNCYFRMPAVRRCIDQVCKQTLLDQNWGFVGKKEGFLLNDVANSGRETFFDVLWQFLSDILVLDKGVLQKVLSNANSVVEVFCRDASTFKEKMDTFGTITGYKQIATVNGQKKEIDFSIDEIVFVKGFPKTYTKRGEPIICSIASEISGVLNWLSSWSKQGSKRKNPFGVLHMSEIGKEARDRAEKSFGTALQTDDAMRIIDGVEKLGWVPFDNNFRELSVKPIIDYCDKVIEKGFGFFDGLDKTSSLVDLLSEHLEEKLNTFLLAGMKAKFVLTKRIRPEEVQGLVTSGLITLNAGRKVWSLAPVKGGDILYVKSPTGLTTPKELGEGKVEELRAVEVEEVEEEQEPIPLERQAKKEPVEARAKNYRISALTGSRVYGPHEQEFIEKRRKLIHEYRGKLYTSYFKFKKSVEGLVVQRGLITRAVADDAETQLNNMIDEWSPIVDDYFNKATDLGKWNSDHYYKPVGGVNWGSVDLSTQKRELTEEKLDWPRSYAERHLYPSVRQLSDASPEERTDLLNKINTTLTGWVWQVALYASVLGDVANIPLIEGLKAISVPREYRRFLWVGMGDGNSCKVCAQLAGIEFSAYELPMRPKSADLPCCTNCRCILIPVLREYAQESKFVGRLFNVKRWLKGDPTFKWESFIPQFKLSNTATAQLLWNRIPGAMRKEYWAGVVVKDVPGLRTVRSSMKDGIRTIMVPKPFKDSHVTQFVEALQPWKRAEAQIPDLVNSVFGKIMFDIRDEYYRVYLREAKKITTNMLDDAARTLKVKVPVKLVGPERYAFVEKEFRNIVIAGRNPKLPSFFRKHKLDIDWWMDPKSFFNIDEFMKKNFSWFITDYEGFRRLPWAPVFQEFLWTHVNKIHPREYIRLVRKAARVPWRADHKIPDILKLVTPAFTKTMTAAQRREGLTWLEEMLTRYPGLRRKEFFKDLRALVVHDNFALCKYSETTVVDPTLLRNFGVKSKYSIFTVPEVYPTAHEMGHHIWKIYIAPNPEARARVLELRRWLLSSLIINAKVYKLTPKNVRWLEREYVKVLKDPWHFIDSTKLSSMMDGMKSGYPLSLRSYCLADPSDIFANAFALSVTSPVVARGSAVQVVDEIEAIVRQFVLKETLPKTTVTKLLALRKAMIEKLLRSEEILDPEMKKRLLLELRRIIKKDPKLGTDPLTIELIDAWETALKEMGEM